MRKSFAKIGSPRFIKKVKKYLRKEYERCITNYVITHEWGRIDEEGILTVGISEHAQDLLGDIVCVNYRHCMELDAEEE